MMTGIIHICQLISDENENLLYKDFEDWQRRKKKKKNLYKLLKVNFYLFI